MRSEKVLHRAMPRRPRELLNPEMRAELRKRIRRVQPPPVVEPAAASSVDDGFRDTELCTWVRIPEDEAKKEVDRTAVGYERHPAKSDGDAEIEVEEFCQLLAAIKADFEKNDRPYAALATSQGIRLVREGKQDDINPGLWTFVSAREKKMKEKETPE